MASPTTIDLSQLPAPDVVEALDFEQILEARKARYLALFAQEDQDAVAKALALESEPMVIVLQENTEREVILRQRVNDAARSVLLAFARGRDLEHIAAEYGVSRQVIQPGNPDAVPPIDPVLESDDELRERAQMAWEGLSTAGPRDGYVFHALSADGQVADATATSPEPCDVLVCVLARGGDGTAAPELLAKVRAKLNDEDIRPLGDRVTVQSSQIVPYLVRAVLHMKGEGPGRTVALDAARKACVAYVNRPRRAGVSVWRSALTASLHVEGVDHLELLEPADDLVLTAAQAATCSDIELFIAAEG
ncbi:baseplate J/gp47 family protein [Achromobacter mucicolens]|uniref:baseplate J/gp47 family protein n=1 Tax=Achromobacter mucicolens TaxID=1389922 RepID=UPI0020A43BBC|nr:baseplate J/gp47 family protein [Achromobacter mucicolens]MCP2517038.1 baseplate J/gp47 family protein [Achromobacter mucicolens]